MKKEEEKEKEHIKFSKMSVEIENDEEEIEERMALDNTNVRMNSAKSAKKQGDGKTMYDKYFFDIKSKRGETVKIAMSKLYKDFKKNKEYLRKGKKDVETNIVKIMVMIQKHDLLLSTQQPWAKKLSLIGSVFSN